jgi:hypothetical protein
MRPNFRINSEGEFVIVDFYEKRGDGSWEFYPFSFPLFP